MDGSSNSILYILIICFIAALIISCLSSQSPERKGKEGELDIVHIISKSIRRGLHGYILHNLYIPKKDGGTSEIDVLFICTKGVYVFESKNYAGWIFGDDRREYWTVTLPAGRNWLGFKQLEKHKFFNPIWQNNSHIGNLRNLIGRSVQIESVIVFSNRSKLKKIANKSDTKIMQTDMLKYYLSSIGKKRQDILTYREVDNLYNILKPHVDTDGEKKKQHMMYIRRLKSNPKRCPKCGGNLVLRTAKKGSNMGRQFFGCSNYPKCEFIKNIK
ncbi:MAG: NERD domain-containing protein [Mogibacterium sp.]|nr:NERD domain-containing protein [Mogibacterium sp.]